METGKVMTLPGLLKSNAIKNRFQEILGGNAANFISSILTIFNDNEKLRKCEPSSILTATAQAANLKLPILPQLGYAYIIPYYDYKSQTYVATFQLGYRGLLQLAMRSNQFRTIHATEIYEGEIKSFNCITGKIEQGRRISNTVIGYAAYFELNNGFEKTLYMTVADIENHARNFSETYRNDKTRQYSIWTKNFNAMAKKTVLKKLLSTFAPISIETKNNTASNIIQAEQTITVTPTDNDFAFDKIDTETGEVLQDVEVSEEGIFDESDNEER